MSLALLENESFAATARGTGSGLVRFGAATLVVGDDADSELRKALERSEALKPLSNAPPNRFHLVVQIGNRFEAEHPEVPVLFGAGRHLIVDMDPERVSALEGHPCYSLRRLKPGETVFDVRQTGAGRRARDS